MLSSRLLRSLVLAGSVVLVTGCVSRWNKEQCTSTNWYQFGMQRGRIADEVNSAEIAQQCAQFDVRVNQTQIARGYRHGLRYTYCTPRNAVRLGQLGKNYTGVCPPDLDRAFRRAWKQGLYSYCKPAVIRQRAIKGKPFPDWCPASLRASLRVAYDQGTRVARRSQVINNQMRVLQNQINDLNSQISRLQKRGISPTSRVIVRLRMQKNQLQQRLFKLQRQQY